MVGPLRRHPRRAAVLCLVLAAGLAGAAGWAWGDARARTDLTDAGWARVALYQANLRTELEKHAAVPLALAQADDVAALLAAPAPAPAGAVAAMNAKLQGIATALSASALYVMNAQGVTVAASNWDAADSFIGRNFAFRPYFRDAMDRGEGHHFALGTTSLVPGFYTAHRVRAENRTPAPPPDAALGAALGAVVLKVGFGGLESGWRAGAERVAVSGRDGVVFITTVESWRYRLLPGIQRPPEEGYEALPWVPADDGTVSVREDGRWRRYLFQTAAVPGGDWSLHVLTPLAPVRDRARTAALLAGGAVGLAGLAGMVLAQRRRSLRERMAWQENARRTAEQRVAEATAELRARENDLVQAAKLAALGQMSAGIAHEINQPLAALRTFADNARVLLERGKTASVADNLAEIADLTDRMASITRQLKGFARRAGGTLGPVEAGRAVRQSLALLETKLRRHRVTVALDLPAAPVWVVGEDVRLQQVLVNLFANAADAAKDRPAPALEIQMTAPGTGEEAAAVVLTVRDNGAGIAADALPRMFVPFFTTKEAGEGLGLGLSISHGIVTDFGGTVTAGNHPDGGALFTVRLKPADPPASELLS
ncbi:two-component system C4-dicarboxylate transport sensor histidine kinase DctB [Azospirillum fermentarium]|uniref:ATP-binding protein n=1 Tax=Azospirillum fermentarium TaxID=1233114 RepID=UPI002226F92A|nr:ATP-binding protein [Azospirillum fermentarium]MCW2245420.1 two-component system C4-dicarboxylate transport sensor histidine kinase DctB [Azospirillum fermentarium]